MKNLIACLICLYCLTIEAAFSQYSFILDSVSVNSRVIFTDDHIYFYSNSITKTDYSGNLIWTKAIASGMNKLVIYGDVMYGLSLQRLCKMDTAGQVLWVKGFYNPVNPSSPEMNNLSDVVYDGHYLYVSTIQATGLLGTPYYPSVLKLDTSGNVLHVAIDYQAPAGGFYLKPCAPSIQSGAWIGYGYQPGFTQYTYLNKIDSSGYFDTTAISPSFFFSTITDLKAIIPLLDSSYLVITNSWSYNQPFALFTCTKITESGNTLWQNSYYNNLSPCIANLSQADAATSDSAGNIYIIGSANEYDCPGNPSGGNFFIKLNGGSGDIQLIKAFPFQQGLSLYNGSIHYKSGLLYTKANYNQLPVIFTLDTSFGNSCYNPDTIVALNKNPAGFAAGVTINPPSTSYTTTIDTITISALNFYASRDFCLEVSSQNYIDTERITLVSPNPTTGKLKIQTEKLIESIQVFNLFGEKVLEATATNEIDLTDQPPGIYFIRLQAEGKIQSFKIVRQ
jgi:hypothetical protein